MTTEKLEIKDHKLMNKKPVIICVDDEKFVLDSIYRQLQRRFKELYEYEFAESAEEALEIIDELVDEGYTIIMVIADQIMPGMKGDEFLSKLYSLYPAVVTILLTGQASLQSAINLINHANLYRYVTKPWDENDLLLTVGKGIEQFNLTRDKQKQLEVFYKFVPAQFLERLSKKDITEIRLGDSVRLEMTVMFADIHNFTTLSESLTPEENFDFINSYLQYIEPAIVNHGGFIDKYIGDAILALFDSPENALQAAYSMQELLVTYNEKRSQNNLLPIQIGMGLCPGEIMLGVVGVTDRMQTTVISDVVNLASRLEGLSKIYDAHILVTQSFIDKLSEERQLNGRFLGKIRVKGKIKDVPVYEALVPNLLEDSLKLETKTEFEEGMDLYFAKKFSEASVKFDNVLRKNPSDQAAKYFLHTCANCMIEGVPEDWTGVTVMSRKDNTVF